MENRNTQLSAQITNLGICMQTITSYNLSAQLGHSLDVDDVLAAIIVSPNDGTVQFNEGKTGLNGMCLTRKVIRCFQIDTQTKNLALVISRPSIHREDEIYVIGRVADEDVDSATSWVKIVNNIYSKPPLDNDEHVTPEILYGIITLLACSMQMVKNGSLQKEDVGRLRSLPKNASRDNWKV
jgi:hypothetical protein